MMTDRQDSRSSALSEDPRDGSSALSEQGSFSRVILLALALIAAAALAYLLPIRTWLRGSGELHQIIASVGLWVYPLGILTVAATVACGVPRLLLCALMGMALGFWQGLLIVQTGTLLGFYSVFIFTRWGGRDWALRRWVPLRKWATLVHEHGTVGVILIRQLPIHGTVINLALGLSHVKHRHFLFGTLIGSLPEAIPATLAGAGLVKPSIKLTAGYLTVAMLIFAGIWIGCGYMLKALRKTPSGSVIVADAAILKGNA
jgi:uncharacterized membrane protein YdjX (TVP38/TMEM64 family)